MSRSIQAPVEETDCIGTVSPAASSYMSAVGGEWQPTGTEGFWVKRLYEDEGRGEQTWLMRIDPGRPLHASCPRGVRAGVCPGGQFLRR